MTAKELVLIAYPDAYIVHYCRGYVVEAKMGPFRKWLYHSPWDSTSEQVAWNDAAIAVKHEMIRRLSE